MWVMDGTDGGLGWHGCWSRMGRTHTAATITPTAITTAPTAAASSRCWRTACAAEGTADVLEHVADALSGEGEGANDQHRDEKEHQRQLNQRLADAICGSRREELQPHEYLVSGLTQRWRASLGHGGRVSLNDSR